MRHVSATAAILGCATLVFTGCSSSGPPEVATSFDSTTANSATTSAPADPANLSVVSLTVTDMPTGWTTSTDKTSMSLGENGCLKTAGRRSDTKTSRYVTFAGVGGAPVFSESLALFPASSMAAAFSAAAKALNACKRVTIKAGTVTLVGALRPTSSPTVGVESKTYTLLATSGAHVLTQYVLICRTSRVLILTSYATVKNPSISDFLALSGRAAAKLS